MNTLSLTKALDEIKKKRQRGCLKLDETVTALTKALRPFIIQKWKFVKQAKKDLDAIGDIDFLIKKKRCAVFDAKIEGKCASVETALFVTGSFEEVVFNIIDKEKTERVFIEPAPILLYTKNKGLRMLASRLLQHGYAKRDIINCIKRGVEDVFKDFLVQMEDIEKELEKVAGPKAHLSGTLADKCHACKRIIEERDEQEFKKAIAECVTALSAVSDENIAANIAEDIDMLERCKAVFGNLIIKGVGQLMNSRYSISAEDKENDISVSMDIKNDDLDKAAIMLTIDNGRVFVSSGWRPDCLQALGYTPTIRLSTNQKKSLPGLITKLVKKGIKDDKTIRRLIEKKLTPLH